jgi:hypothetical protein
MLQQEPETTGDRFCRVAWHVVHSADADCHSTGFSRGQVTNWELFTVSICSDGVAVRKEPHADRRQTMRSISLSILLVMALASYSSAQDKPISLPEIRVGGEQKPAEGNQAAPGGTDRCVDVEIGSSHAFDCLNRKLREQADRANPNLPSAPLDAKSQDLKVGTVNIPAVQQQYGKNFGISVVPYRPPPPIYTIPMGRH